MQNYQIKNKFYETITFDVFLTWRPWFMPGWFHVRQFWVSIWLLLVQYANRFQVHTQYNFHQVTHSSSKQDCHYSWKTWFCFCQHGSKNASFHQHHRLKTINRKSDEMSKNWLDTESLDRFTYQHCLFYAPWMWCGFSKVNIKLPKNIPCSNWTWSWKCWLFHRSFQALKTSHSCSPESSESESIFPTLMNHCPFFFEEPWCLQALFSTHSYQ